MRKRPFSLLEIVNLNFGFLGIQFGWGLQMANMSGIYKFLGAQTAHLPLLWLAAPITGIIIQPILGKLSDFTWIKALGRRKPYILGGAFAATLALILMPQSTSLWMAAVLLWVLDGAINASMQPYRALVADVIPENQYTKAFALQTFLTGIGATFATALPWLFVNVFHISGNTLSGHIPLSIKLSFYIGAAIFLLANIWTIISSKEYAPSDLVQWQVKKKANRIIKGKFWKNLLIDFIFMPKVMRQVGYVQFFSWAGWFCLITYFSLGVAENIYNLPVGVNIVTNVEYSRLLEKGVALSGLLFSLYTLLSCFYALLLTRIVKIFSRKYIHALSLLIGAIGMVSANYAHTIIGLAICMIGLGVAWTSIITLPYAILAGILPKEKMGQYMGLFNITIVIPQILASLLLGLTVVKLFHNHAMSVVAFGGLMYAFAALFSCFIDDKPIDELV